MLLLGGIAGIVAMLLDRDTQLLGDLFSKMGIWVLIGVTITFLNKKPIDGAVAVLLFTIGLTCCYYLTAELTGMYWHYDYLHLWLAISCISPILSLLVGYSRRKDILAKVIRVGVVAVPILYDFVVQDVNVLDFVIYATVIYMVYFYKKIQ